MCGLRRGGGSGAGFDYNAEEMERILELPMQDLLRQVTLLLLSALERARGRVSVEGRDCKVPS